MNDVEKDKARFDCVWSGKFILNRKTADRSAAFRTRSPGSSHLCTACLGPEENRNFRHRTTARLSNTVGLTAWHTSNSACFMAFYDDCAPCRYARFVKRAEMRDIDDDYFLAPRNQR
jgi:hypothetical protein